MPREALGQPYFADSHSLVEAQPPLPRRPSQRATAGLQRPPGPRHLRARLNGAQQSLRDSEQPQLLGLGGWQGGAPTALYFPGENGAALLA